MRCRTFSLILCFQMLSGLSPWMYWSTAFVWDAALFAVRMFAFVGIFYMFNIEVRRKMNSFWVLCREAVNDFSNSRRSSRRYSYCYLPWLCTGGQLYRSPIGFPSCFLQHQRDLRLSSCITSSQVDVCLEIRYWRHVLFPQKLDSFTIYFLYKVNKAEKKFKKDREQPGSNWSPNNYGSQFMDAWK